MLETRISWVFIALLFALPSLAMQYFDDTYIHARIIERFHLLGTMNFNDGQSGKIDSSTGWVLLMGLFGAIGVQTLMAFSVMNFLVICLFTLLMLNLRSPLRWWLLLAALPYTLIASYGGMETALVSLLMLLAFVLHERSMLVTSLLLLLASIIRVECYPLLVAVLGIGLIRRTLTVSQTLLILAIAAGFLVGELGLLGDIVPHAATAKRIGYNHPLLAQAHSILKLRLGGSLYPMAAGALLLLLFYVAQRACRSSVLLSVSDAYLGFAVLLLGLWVFSQSNQFEWYGCLFATAVVLGVAGRDDWQRLGRYAAICLLVILSVAGVRDGFQLVRGFIGENLYFVRVDRYIQISRGLYAYCPSCTLMTSEVGGLGYGFKGTVLDGFGLADARAMKYHPMKVPEERSNYATGAIPRGYIDEMDPDFIVSMPTFIEDFKRSYRYKASYVYHCPLSLSHPDRVLWSSTSIELIAKRPLPAATLMQTACLSRKGQ